MSFLDLFMRNNKSEKVRFLSLFSGIGAFEKALDNIGVQYDLVGFSEIDKYVVKSYCAVHGVDESMNLGDITKISEADLPKNIDLITYGFPCQDISLAGKQKGMFNEDGTQTRSGLFFEALRIIEETQPKVAIAENVKNLTSKKFSEQFKIVLDSLEQAGYNNYWQVLNAKDFGIPQNRERVFIISIRKNIDDGKFRFPEPVPLELRLKDMLEDEVDEKFYISSFQLENLVRNGNNNCNPSGKGMNDKVHTGDVAPTITTNKGEGPKIEEPSINMVGMLDMKGNEQVRRVYGTDGLSPTLNTMQGGHRQPKVLVREATKKGYAEAYEGDSINLEQPNSKTRRGRVGGVANTLTTSPQQGVVVSENKFTKNKNIDMNVYREMALNSNCELPCAVDEQNVSINKGGTVGTITTDGSSPKHNNRVLETSLRIRKLTPKECWRLMGFEDTDFEKAEKVNSNTQLYKQAGNSIVVDVLEALFINLKPYLK